MNDVSDAASHGKNGDLDVVSGGNLAIRTQFSSGSGHSFSIS